MTKARKTIINVSDTPYYHCMGRCVRRAFLCGVDNFSGKDYSHRKQWIVDKLEELELSSPIWHKDVLEQRQAKIDQGCADFIDWEQAKSNIRQVVK